MRNIIGKELAENTHWEHLINKACLDLFFCHAKVPLDSALEVKYVVRRSNKNFINQYPQPVFHSKELQLRCVKVILSQTLQRRPLASHASKFRVIGNIPSAPEIVISPQTFLAVRHAFLPYMGPRCSKPPRETSVGVGSHTKRDIDRKAS